MITGVSSLEKFTQSIIAEGGVKDYISNVLGESNGDFLHTLGRIANMSRGDNEEDPTTRNGIINQEFRKLVKRLNETTNTLTALALQLPLQQRRGILTFVAGISNSADTGYILPYCTSNPERDIFPLLDTWAWAYNQMLTELEKS